MMFNFGSSDNRSAQSRELSRELQRAIEANLASRVADIIATGSIDINAPLFVTAFERMFPLSLAASKGFGRIVEILLDAGADIDARDHFGFTACYVAVRNRHNDVAMLLVSRGASLASRGDNRLSPLSVAMTMNNESLAVALIEAGSPLDDANTICDTVAKSEAVLRALLQKGVDFSRLRNNEGQTACHIAARRADTAEVAAVFTTLTTVAAIDIDAQADDGSTCAHVCAANQHVNLLRALVDLGANLNLVDAYGRTALHTALISLNHQCALLLLAAGIDVHVKDAQGRTVCHYAASGVANSLIPLEILHAVLAARADFDAPDNDGSTPRQICLDHNRSMPTVHEIECAKRRIVRKQLEIVRRRAVQVCLGLQPLGLDALCMCEILAHACGPVAPFVPFHCWWQIATTVKHFAQDNKR